VSAATCLKEQIATKLAAVPCMTRRSTMIKGEMGMLTDRVENFGIALTYEARCGVPAMPTLLQQGLRLGKV
jgi:hypothetical protein